MSERLYIEKRTLQGSRSLSWDLAQHLSTRYGYSTVVIAERPTILLASISKQWQKIIRQIQRARSGTLNAALIYELTQQLSKVQQMRMTTKIPEMVNEDGLDVHFLTSDQALAKLPVCQTLYCTVALTEQNLQKITTSLPIGSLVVMYE